MPLAKPPATTTPLSAGAANGATNRD